MASIVDQCLAVVEGREAVFLSAYTGASARGMSANKEELYMLVESFARCYPQQFVEAVGAFLHDYVEVGSSVA